MYFIILGFVLIIVELLYFRVARRFRIIDKPNERSLHEEPTIRGGGIIFPIALVIFYLTAGEISYYFVFATLLLAVVGMADDFKGLSRSLRFGVQMMAMLLIFYDLNVLEHAWWVIIILLIIATGTVNAYNFMDGINGLTGGYSLVVLGSLYYINNNAVHFVNNDLLLIMMMALGVFSFFNFRTKAICFAGDVGSLTMGFAMIYLILKLIMVSHNYVFVLLLAIYATDSVLTIIHRLILKQNIFEAHRLHLFQVIISVSGMHHLAMTIIYIIIQMIVNGVIIYNLNGSQPMQYIMAILISGLLGLTYVLAKRYFYKSHANVL
ncbi:MAG TPA: glycosyltransferase family 4 protein [Chitinophagaceae bacterium]|jgi:UDP-N-acetylmuramyl pentapeptide phosphotransferase/UDP-N-acetylglucosamine-1-phosphate transferase|nr:glycosyltransferase family 4 protein [Chitinophagaceae bacterium]